MRENEKNTAIYVAYEEAVPFDPAAPEKNLLRAVLLSAMLDLKKQGDPRRKALEYFLSPDEDYVFSFASVCSFLNVDQDKILSVTGLKSTSQGVAAVLHQTVALTNESGREDSADEGGEPNQN